MKDNKGITLITLVITITILIVLSFSISINIESYTEYKVKSNFEYDITILEEEINQYYARHKTLPVINEYINHSQEGFYSDTNLNENDNENYYVIDISLLDVKLNYGKEFEKIKEENNDDPITEPIDIYIINEQSHTIYNPKGIEYKGKTYYRSNATYTKIN